MKQKLYRYDVHVDVLTGRKDEIRITDVDAKTPYAAINMAILKLIEVCMFECGMGEVKIVNIGDNYEVRVEYREMRIVFYNFRVYKVDTSGN